MKEFGGERNQDQYNKPESTERISCSIDSNSRRGEINISENLTRDRKSEVKTDLTNTSDQFRTSI